MLRRTTARPSGSYHLHLPSEESDAKRSSFLSRDHASTHQGQDSRSLGTCVPHYGVRVSGPLYS